MIDLPAMLDAKQTGPNRWLAKCPAHDDQNPSLSITQVEDGTWYYKCWAGCEQIAVVDALGIEFRDLFPNKGDCFDRFPDKAIDRRISRVENPPRLSAADALGAIDNEAHVVWVVGNDMLDKREISEKDWKRLATAIARIASARDLCTPKG